MPHLFFPKDVVLFAEARPHRIRELSSKRYSTNFARTQPANGLILLKVASFCSYEVTDTNKDGISDLLGIPISLDFGNCLGVLLLAIGCLLNDQYMFQLDKVKAQLSGWKSKTLSLAGRVTLANSVLTRLPLLCDAINLPPVWYL